MERRCPSNLKHNWWNTVNTVVLPCHFPVSGLGQGERKEPCCKIFLSRIFMQYAVDFVYHSQTFHLKMRVGQCKSWGKRPKYENKSYWKSSDLFLRASPCASSPAYAWDSGRGELLEFLSTLCSLYNRSENSNCRMRGKVSVLPWNSSSQSQNAAAVPTGFGRSSQGLFFFFPKTDLSTAGDTQVLVNLGTMLRKKRADLWTRGRIEVHCCRDVGLNDLLSPAIHFLKLLYPMAKLTSLSDSLSSELPLWLNSNLTENVGGPFPAHSCEEPRAPILCRYLL